MSGGSLGDGAPSLATQAAALEEIIDALGCRPLAAIAGRETDPEKLQLFAQIAVQKAPAEKRKALIDRLRRLQLL